MRCSKPGGSVAVASVASRAQMELKLSCTAQRMLGRCRLRLKTPTAQGAWVVRPLRHAPVKSDRNKSLQQLEGEDWGEPTFDSQLVKECHRLHRVPLRDLTVEDLRITIGQQIGLEYLVPLALERLHDDPFAEGAYYPCDLLVSVLGAEAQFWQRHPELREQLIAITERAISMFPSVPDVASKTVTRAVRRAYDEFQRRQTTVAS